MKKILLFLFFAAFTLAGAEQFAVSFARGKWNNADFLVVKSPRFNKVETFTQQSDHIANMVPPELANKPSLSCADSYCAIVTAKKFSGNVTISSRMSFDQRMAPLIVIAPELGKSADGKYPELRDHYEIVLYDKGINVWHHRYINGKPAWYKLAYILTPYKAKTVYDLEVTLKYTVKGPQMIIKCDGKEFGVAMPVEFTAKEYHLGIIGCEGINRFYDFRVK